jgi:hypothetical protein
MTEPQGIDLLLSAEAIDAGCAAGFEVLHRYVETELADGDPADEFPGLATHLRDCPACREDYLGLLEAARRFGDANDVSSA